MSVEGKPNKYERNRIVRDKPNRLDRLWNPYSKIKETVNDIISKED